MTTETKNNFLYYSTQISRFIVGALFVFSGFVKTIDPKGTEYKLHEYFSLSDSVLNAPFLAENAFYLAVFFVLFEVMLGLLLLLGIWKKFTLPTLVLTILFFTFLTFYSAYYNKVTDCGCFGDFLKLEPWTSFYKDVFLLILIIILVIGHKYIEPIFSKNVNFIILFFGVIISVFVAHLGINHNPIADFRPFAVGKSIPEGMNNGKPAKVEMLYTLKHSKTKEIKSMNDSVYMASKIWEDSLWVIDESKNKENILKEAIKPSINGFFINTENGDDTEKYIKMKNLVLIVFPEQNYCSEGEQKMYDLVRSLDQKKVNILAISTSNQVMKGIPNGIVDDKIMKAMTRSTPGILLINNGIVKAKFHHHDTPTATEIYDIFQNK